MDIAAGPLKFAGSEAMLQHPCRMGDERVKGFECAAFLGDNGKSQRVGRACDQILAVIYHTIVNGRRLRARHFVKAVVEHVLQER